MSKWIVEVPGGKLKVDEICIAKIDSLDTSEYEDGDWALIEFSYIML